MNFDCVVLPEDARQRLIFGQAMRRGMQAPLAQVEAGPRKSAAVPIALAIGVLGLTFYIFFATLSIEHDR